MKAKAPKFKRVTVVFLCEDTDAEGLGYELETAFYESEYPVTRLDGWLAIEDATDAEAEASFEHVAYVPEDA